jgi:hypothetical protein
MHAHRTRLELAGVFLAGVPSTDVEWSLQVSRTRAVVRDRVIFWTGRHGSAGNPEAFARTGAFLRALGAPAAMLELQGRLAPHSIRQGIGVAEDDETCLYVHHADPSGGREHCEAWKWRGGETAAHSFYEFHFLPHTPSGVAPGGLMHPELRPLWRSLAADERVRALSGFWLRHRDGRTDQVSLTYPWQPAVGELAAALPCRIAQLEPWHDWHFRHVAMNGADAAEPALTFYFSGALRGTWPRDLTELREQVERSARHANAVIRSEIFERLPVRRAVREDASVRETESEAELLARLSAGIPHGGSVYVIGCGWGTVSAFLAQTLRCRVVGITSDPEQYAHCAARGLRTRLGSAAETLPPGRFDAIVVLDAAARTDLHTLRLFGDRVLVSS